MDGDHFATLMSTPDTADRLINRTSQITRIVTNIGKAGVVKIIEDNMENGDKSVVNAFNSMVQLPKSSDNKWLKKRGSRRAQDVLRLFQTAHLTGIEDNANNLLDIGAGDCYNTIAIGVDAMNLEMSQIYAIDIAQWGENINKKPTDEISFEFIDPKNVKIPFDVQFNRIVLLQSLHHIQNLADMMYEINRVASPGAIVIIREHDCRSGNMSRLIDIEHMLYDVAVDKIEYDKFVSTYYGKYRSQSQWTNIFESFMFRRIPTKPIINPGDTNYYYAMYQKIGCAKPFEKYSIDTLMSIYNKLSTTVRVTKKWKKSDIIKEIRNII